MNKGYTKNEPYEIGDRVGKWTVLGSSRRKSIKSAKEILCTCDCGATKWQYEANLHRNMSLQCDKCRIKTGVCVPRSIYA